MRPSAVEAAIADASADHEPSMASTGASSRVSGSHSLIRSNWCGSIHTSRFDTQAARWRRLNSAVGSCDSCDAR